MKTTLMLLMQSLTLSFCFGCSSFPNQKNYTILSKEEIERVVSGSTVFLRVGEKVVPLYLDDAETMSAIFGEKMREGILFVDDKTIRGGYWEYAQLNLYNKPFSGICIQDGSPTVGAISGARGWKGSGRSCFVINKTPGEYQFMCTPNPPRYGGLGSLPPAPLGVLCLNKTPGFAYDVVKVDRGDTMQLNAFLDGRRSETLKLVRQVQGAFLQATGKLLQESQKTCSNNLFIRAQSGSIFPTTVKKFSASAKGISCIYNHTDSSGSGFLQTGYSNFDCVCPGEYEITIAGYDGSNKLFHATFNHVVEPGAGSTYCDVNLSTKNIFCQSQ